MKTIPHYDVPRDDSDARYIRSFALDDRDAALEFFGEFGFVVFQDVLTAAECEASVDRLFELVGFDRADPHSWGSWPKSGLEKYAMPSRSPVFDAQFLMNRQHPNVHRAFASILGREDLLSNHDRACLFRPTVAVPFRNGPRDMPQWRTARGLHFDMNPWKYVDVRNHSLANLEAMDYGTPNQFIFENNQVSLTPGSVHLQGVINFLDNLEEDGGFIVVPGFIHHYDEWVKANAHLSGVPSGGTDDDINSYVFSAKDPLQQQAIRISMRQGSVVIWDQRMPHGSTFNQSSNFRCAQFLKMFPNELSPGRAARRGNALLTIFRRTGFDRRITPLGMRTFGLS